MSLSAFLYFLVKILAKLIPMKSLIFVLLCFASGLNAYSQVSASVPGKVNANSKYLFYLHGGIVQDQGENAVSTYFGPYLYRAILDTLSNRGYHVISERRPKGTKEKDYALVVADQVRKLLLKSVPIENISIVGASQGAWIALETTLVLKNKHIKYALLGICNAYNTNHFMKYQQELCGNFLSIYERSDQKKSCNSLLNNQLCKGGYQEVALNMGNGHGFLYKPYPEWVNPLIAWLAEN